MTTAIEVNCETGEVTERPLTQAEIAANEAAAAQAEADRLAREQEALAVEQAKASAVAKLSSLGLTPDEISALTGK
jgi:hypothetical protein